MLGKSEVEEAVQTAADMEVRACKEEPQAEAWEQALVAETTDASVQEALMESCRSTCQVWICVEVLAATVHGQRGETDFCAASLGPAKAGCRIRGSLPQAT